MNKQKLLLQYITFDLFAAMLVWILFMIFRKTVNDAQVFEDVNVFVPNFNYFSSLIIYPFTCLFIHYLSGFYLHPERKNQVQIIFTSILSSAIISISIFFALMLDDIVISYEYYYYSLLVLFGLQLVFTYISRTIIWAGVRNNYRSKRWKTNTIIVGTGKNAEKMAKEIEINSQKNFVTGFIQVDNAISVDKERILGNLAQLGSIINEQQVEEAIISLDNADEQRLFSYINELYKYNIDIRFTPRLYEILTGSARIGSIGINPLVSITQINMSDFEISIKRFIDIVISTIALLLMTPLFIYFGIAIKRDSKGPVFYKQERIGRYGIPFDIIKFRTMHQGAENGVPKLSSADDERITRIGRILRKYRIDELPQFWNILKGEMSLVGPRPERRFYINQIIGEAPYYCLLYKIRPGLTSWGPIKIGYSDTIEKMIERLNYDIIYMENMSLFNDIKILVLTVEIIIKGKGV
ncbi:MAG: sugar transferase [Paludibacteraceae bacterium]|nr:sugar transferase [Paludibacteraceae bacterium]